MPSKEEQEAAHARWLDWLRQRLGREPTEKDVRIARAYDDMARQKDAFADDIEEMKALDQAKLAALDPQDGERGDDKANK
jgi:hypothetical protein